MRNPQKLLNSVAKNDAKLQDIINRFDNFEVVSDEEINNLNTKPWIKDALFDRKKIAEEHKRFVEIEKYVLANCKTVINENFSGEIYKWTAADEFVPFGASSILIRTGDLLFITDKGVWLDTAFTKNVNLSKCIFVKSSKVLEYRDEIRKLIMLRYPEIATQVEKENKPLYTIKRY